MAEMTKSEQVFGSKTKYRNAMLYLYGVQSNLWLNQESRDKQLEAALIEHGYMVESATNRRELTFIGKVELDMYEEHMCALGVDGIKNRQREMLRYLANEGKAPKEGWSPGQVRILWSLKVRDLIDGKYADEFVINQNGVAALAKTNQVSLEDHSSKSQSLAPPAPDQTIKDSQKTEEQEFIDDYRAIEVYNSQVINALREAAKHYQHLKGEGCQNITCKVKFSYTIAEIKEDVIE